MTETMNRNSIVCVHEFTSLKVSFIKARSLTTYIENKKYVQMLYIHVS